MLRPAGQGEWPPRPFTPAIYVILAPEERDAGTSPQGNSSAQRGHRSHLLHSNQILSYAMSMALVGMGHIGQRVNLIMGLSSKSQERSRKG